MGKTVASASQRGKKRTPKLMNEKLVNSYLGKLEASLGEERRFMDVYNELLEDQAIQQAEAVAIASRFVAPTAASTPRGKALERVLRRHSSLASFKLKQRATAGRSAA
jgi:hypothetical protein